MIDEKTLEALLAGESTDAMIEVIGTALTLWKVVRAARRWTNASPGLDASQAETKLRDALDRVKEIQRNLG